MPSESNQTGQQVTILLALVDSDQKGQGHLDPEIWTTPPPRPEIWTYQVISKAKICPP